MKDHGAAAVAEIVAELRAAGCVFAEAEADLLIAAAEDGTGLALLVQRRVAGIPLEYILGWSEFCGLHIRLSPGVFVPRRRTEFLVQEVLGLVASDPVIVDLCCGAGAVGAALADALGPVVLYVADIDPAAVRCAELNIGSRGTVLLGDLFDPLPAELAGRVDLLAVNAPYVPTDAIALMPPEAREHEHRVALDGGVDGLDVVRRVAEQAPYWLAPGGHLLIETSSAQSAELASIFAAAGLSARIAESEEFHATVAIGTLDRWM